MSNINVLLVGFGRMGLSHLSIINGLLGVDNVIFHIVDSSLTSRMLAKLLIKNCCVYSPSSLTCDLIDEFEFKYALITTPPSVRDDVLNLLKDRKTFIFVEKPVLFPLLSNMMSGYVLQHAPLNTLVKSQLSNIQYSKVTACLQTNLDFSSVSSGWRSGSYGNVLYEFGGHLLSVLCLFHDKLLMNYSEITSLNVIVNSRNACKFSFFYDNIVYEIDLIASSTEVRKATYLFNFYNDNSELVLSYDLYGINSSSNPISMAHNGVSTDYYIRGFEFSDQMSNFLTCRGDLIKSDQILNLEKLIGYVNGIFK